MTKSFLLRRLALTGVSALAFGVAGTPASAQDNKQTAQAPALEEIIVTSRKRESP